MAAPSSPLLPRLRHSDPELVRWAEEFCRALEDTLARLQTPAGQTAYALSNVTESRSLDPTTATTAATAQVVATLVRDLSKKGFVAS